MQRFYRVMNGSVICGTYSFIICRTYTFIICICIHESAAL